MLGSLYEGGKADFMNEENSTFRKTQDMKYHESEGENRHLNLTPQEEYFIEAIAVRTSEMILRNLYERRRNEISVEEICKEFNICRETIRRRIKAGLLPQPQLKRGKNWFPRQVIEAADIKGIL
jgi:hypothetical protein